MNVILVICLREITTIGVLICLSGPLLSRSSVVDPGRCAEAEHELLPLLRLQRVGIPSKTYPVKITLQVLPPLSHVQRYHPAEERTEGVNPLQGRKRLRFSAVYRHLFSA